MNSLEAHWEKGPYGGTSDGYYNKNDDSVFLKLFHQNIPTTTAEKEFHTAKLISECGNIPVAKALEMVEHNGRTGIIFERASGKTFAELLGEHEVEICDCAKEFGLEARKLHSAEIDLSDFSSAKDDIEESIENVFKSRRIKAVFTRLLEQLYSTSEKEVLLHGDLHPGNIMLSKDGANWIDMGYASKGPVIWDFTATDMMMNYPITFLFTKNPYGLSIKEMRQFYAQFIKSYFDAADNKEVFYIKRQIRHYSPLYVCYIINKESWKGIAKLGMKAIIIPNAVLHKRCS